MKHEQRCEFAKKRADTNRVELQFGNQVMDFETYEDAEAFVDRAFSSIDELLQVMLLKWARVNGNLTDAANKTITLDFNAKGGAIVRVTNG